jgi:hypothetical protein
MDRRCVLAADAMNGHSGWRYCERRGVYCGLPRVG